MPNQNRRALLAGILLAGGGIGVLSGLSGVFTKAVCAGLGFSRGEFSAIGSIATLVSAFAAPFSARRLREGSLRREVLAGALVCGSAPLVYSVSFRLWQFYLAAAVSGFFLNRVTMLAVGILLARTGEKNRGRALGIAFAGTGLFTAAATPLAQQAVLLFGWRWAYRLTGTAALLLLVPTALFLLPGGSDCGEQPCAAPKESSFQEKGASFAAAAAGIFLVNLCNLAMTNHALPYLTDLGYGTRAASVVSGSMILLAAARIGAGIFYDRRGARAGTRLLALGVFLTALCALELPGKNALALYMPLLAVSGTASALPAAALSKNGDGRQNDAAYARLTRAASLGSACGTPLAGLVFDRAGSYRPMWTLCAVFAAAAWVLFTLAAKRSQRGAEIK